MFFEQLVILGDVSIIKVGNAKIEEDVEKEGKVENHKIKTIIRGTYNILHAPVDTKYPKGLDQKIKEKYKNQIR
jgi:hypothetical protein